MPQEIAIGQAEVAQVLAGPVSQILAAARSALENSAPELAADIVDQGIVLTGGGALFRRLDEALALSTGVPVRVPHILFFAWHGEPAQRLRIRDMPACSPT